MIRILPFLLTLLLVFPACAEELWTPREAPVVRKTLSEEEKLQARQALLEAGTLLYAGATDKGYYPAGAPWLKAAQPDDAVAILYACDDPAHGGWGVLGLDVHVLGKHVKIADIPAASDQPEKERLVVYTVQDIMESSGAASPADFTAFSLGAWNGGRIAGLYYLPAEAAQALSAWMSEVDAMEAIIHTYSGELSNPNAIDSARAVYAYLKDTWGKGCLTGQMESTWMGSPDYEMNYLFKHTGKLPAIRGLDFMHNDFKGVARRAAEWWEKGGIPTICWHTGPDFASAYNESKDHDINWEEAFIPGSETYNALLKGMDRAVPALLELQEAGVPVLWRPFHELDGGWFWWSKGGSEGFVKLWQMMYSRYTDYWGLNNLIWTLGYSHVRGDMAAWYPGDAYVDLMGGDSYTPGANGILYEDCVKIAAPDMPLVFHECGAIPTQAQMEEANAPWLLFMVWHTSHLTDGQSNTPESLHAVYNSDYFITLDELPSFR